MKPVSISLGDDDVKALDEVVYTARRLGTWPIANRSSIVRDAIRAHLARTPAIPNAPFVRVRQRPIVKES